MTDDRDYDWKSHALELTDLSNWCSPNAAYSTYQKTSDGDKPSCWPNNAYNNVWFKFTATSNILTISLRDGGSYGNMHYGRMAVTDVSGTQVGCVTNIVNQGTTTLQLTTLTPGDEYYLNVDNYYGSSHWGSFTLCLHDGTITWTGTTNTDWNTVTNWDVAIPTAAFNAEIPVTAPNQPVLTGTGTCNDLRLNPGTQLTVTSGSDLSVNGNMIVEASSSGTASVVDNGILNVSGSTNVEHYYTDSRWHFISSPVSNSVSNVFLDIYLKDWDEASYTWSYITSTSLPFAIGTGYEIWSTIGDPTVSFNDGILNKGDISPVVSATDANIDLSIDASEGWNLVGNPFPSAIDVGTENDPVTGYTWTNLDNSLYFWNGSQYASFSMAGNGAGVNGGTRYVPSAQGFFVKANDFAPAMTIPSSARLHNAQANYKSSETNFAKLTVEGNGYSDEILIRAIEGAESSFDTKYDAFKLWGIDEAPQLFSIVGDEVLSINTISEITDKTIIPIGLKVGNIGNYSLNLNEVELPDVFQQFYIEDLKTGSTEEVSLNREYHFEADPIDEPYRFNLHFGNVGNNNENHLTLINIYSNDNLVFVNISNQVDGDINIYDITGKKLIHKEINNNNSIEIKVGNGSGVYFVEVISDLEYQTEKLFIK